MSLAAVRDLRDARSPVGPQELAAFETDVLETWLRSHPGIEVVCRDGSGAYGKSRELHLTGELCPVSRLCRRSRYRRRSDT